METDMAAFLIFTIEILVSYLLQSTVFMPLAIGDVVPDLLLIVTVAAGYQNSRIRGMQVGFFCGLLLDIGTGGGVLGVYALFYMVIGYFSGHFNPYYVQKDILFPLGIIAGSEFALCSAVYVFKFLIRGNLDFTKYVRQIFLPRILYTIAIAVVYYTLMVFLYERVINRKAEDEAFLAPESIVNEENK